MAKLIFGCGYLGVRVAQRWLSNGHEVHALTRSQTRGEELAELGLQPHIGDVTAQLPRFATYDTVLFAVGFDRQSGASIDEVYVQGLQNALESLNDRPQRILYISSTGVYAQSHGEWVDELSPCQPQRPGGRACLAAEGLLQAHAYGQQAIVLRLAGIYGPQRLPRLESLQRGESLQVSGEDYLNLIHVDDAAHIVCAAESAPAPNCYTISDGHPVRRNAFYGELARLVGAPTPRFEPNARSSAALGRGGSNKRVSNRKMCAQLGVTLSYPNYQAGLAQILEQHRQP